MCIPEACSCGSCHLGGETLCDPSNGATATLASWQSHQHEQRLHDEVNQENTIRNVGLLGKEHSLCAIAERHGHCRYSVVDQNENPITSIFNIKNTIFIYLTDVQVPVNGFYHVFLIM